MILSLKRTINAIWQKKNHPDKRFVWVVIDNELCIGFGQSTSNRDGLGVKVYNHGRVCYIKPNWVILAKETCYGDVLLGLSDRKTQQVIEGFLALSDSQIHVSMFEHKRDKTLRGRDREIVLEMLCNAMGVVQNEY